ncbi:MAG: 4-(cytidine 5'-diphospho)-2-C-methyl-D-erythritol kinase [Candidatus Hydrogenedentota bacterium]|nr:MAG: 4-(cytidine 5'-diphospho)-2-C-methyl-D-erythritol kinase [Candidatus Hydrogenedentota bacterium]
MLETAAYAKLNLYLQVSGRRSDGYHELEMFNLRLNLCDVVRLEPAEEIGLTIIDQRRRSEAAFSDSAAIPDGKMNLAWKAQTLFRNTFDIADSYQCTITKRIPIGAGLGGGSADAAAVLELLGKRHGIERRHLLQPALRLGADVPYCLFSSPAVVSGIGEMIEPVSSTNSFWFVVCHPGAFLSTPDVFSRFDATRGRWDQDRISSASLAEVRTAFEEGDPRRLGKSLFNALEPIAAEICPEIAVLRQKLRDCGALGAQMTGSGSAVFGIFEDRRTAFQAEKELAGDTASVFVAHSLAGTSKGTIK